MTKLICSFIRITYKIKLSYTILNYKIIFICLNLYSSKKTNPITDDYTVVWDGKLGCGITGPVR